MRRSLGLFSSSSGDTPVEAHLHPAERIGGRGSRAAWRDRGVGERLAPADARPVVAIAQVDDEALDLLLVGVERTVGIDVLFVEPVVADRAVRAAVAERLQEADGR